LQAAEMTSLDLNDKQIAAIEQRIIPMLRYLSRLAERAGAKLPPDDSLRQRVVAAHDAMHGLRVALHYLHSGCRNVTHQDRWGLPLSPPVPPSE
jgi:hypothetical protein